MFYESDLSVANFTGAALDEAKMGKARMVRTVLDKAKLPEAMLMGARLDDASLRGAELPRASKRPFAWPISKWIRCVNAPPAPGNGST